MPSIIEQTKQAIKRRQWCFILCDLWAITDEIRGRYKNLNDDPIGVTIKNSAAQNRELERLMGQLSSLGYSTIWIMTRRNYNGKNIIIKTGTLTNLDTCILIQRVFIVHFVY